MATFLYLLTQQDNKLADNTCSSNGPHMDGILADISMEQQPEMQGV